MEGEGVGGVEGEGVGGVEGEGKVGGEEEKWKKDKKSVLQESGVR